MAWASLASVELSGSQDTLDSGTFTATRYLQIFVRLIADGQINCKIAVNNNQTGSEYSQIIQTNGNAASLDTSNNEWYFDIGYTTADLFVMINAYDNTTTPQLSIGNVVGFNSNDASAGLDQAINSNKWVNSDPITEINIINGGTGSFASGSNIQVFGTEGDT